MEKHLVVKIGIFYVTATTYAASGASQTLIYMIKKEGKLMGKYSVEKNTQMLIALMKEHGIKKVVASPGMKNMPFIASVQYDDFFEVYSCVDERSAAYMACGMALESGEPVALSCTGATASRNYASALTEAYYRHIPILAITSMSYTGEVGHLIPQVIDRSVQMKDLVYKSVELQEIVGKKDEWNVNTKINDALLTLRRGNGGPVHINLVNENFTDFTDKLISTRRIDRLLPEDEFPALDNKRVAIFVGAHNKWHPELVKYVDEFCEKYNAAVICDKTSNYYGKYRVDASVLNQQGRNRPNLFSVDVLIHIGDVSGAYINFSAREVWRINLDGEIRDTFKKIRYVFQVSELFFFKTYSMQKSSVINTSYYSEWIKELNNIYAQLPELPFSNAWIAQNTGYMLPDNSIVFLGILNSLRNWNFFPIKEVPCYSNVGGFGIDGMLSTAIGAAISNSKKIVYIILGDLSFFYDMNSLGNRHLPSNIRIILINNGRGVEFRNYGHMSAAFGDDADDYMAAARHFGNKSSSLVRNYAEDLGLEYHGVNNKQEYLNTREIIVSKEYYDKPLLIECFTTTEDESNSLKMISTILKGNESQLTNATYRNIGKRGLRKIKRIVTRICEARFLR